MASSDTDSSFCAAESGSQCVSWLSVEIVHRFGDWNSFPDPDGAVRQAVAAVGCHPDVPRRRSGLISVALTNNDDIRQLNVQFRNIDKATNVLSFPSFHPTVLTAGDSNPVFIGDIVLAAEIILNEAGDESRAPGNHLQHLVVHGVLHLLGFDHDTVDEARSMESLEIAILAGLGIEDPYAEDDAPGDRSIVNTLPDR